MSPERPRASPERPRASRKESQTVTRGSQSVLERPQSHSIPGASQKRSKSLPMSRPSVCGELSAVCGELSAIERAFGSIFRRFCLAARKLRCALCTSFYNIWLAGAQSPASACAWRKRSKNLTLRPPKSLPGVWASQNRARAAQFERKSMLEVPPGPFMNGHERSNCERESATASGQERADPQNLRAVFSNLRMDFSRDGSHHPPR